MIPHLLSVGVPEVIELRSAFPYDSKEYRFLHRTESFWCALIVEESLKRKCR